LDQTEVMEDQGHRNLLRDLHFMCLAQPHNQDINELYERASNYHFHDTNSTIQYPKLTLACLASAFKLTTITQSLKNGKYKNTK
jgi:hypothetical protein